MSLAPPDRRSAVAADLLRRVFAPLGSTLTFRLWDGTTARGGRGGESAFTIVFRTPAVFRRLVRRPTPLRFGEAFIGGEIDIEGDVFEAMRVATEVERLRVALRTRIAVLMGLLRI